MNFNVLCINGNQDYPTIIKEWIFQSSFSKSSWRIDSINVKNSTEMLKLLGKNEIKGYNVIVLNANEPLISMQMIQNLCTVNPEIFILASFLILGNSSLTNFIPFGNSEDDSLEKILDKNRKRIEKKSEHFPQLPVLCKDSLARDQGELILTSITAATSLSNSENPEKSSDNQGDLLKIDENNKIDEFDDQLAMAALLAGYNIDSSTSDKGLQNNHEADEQDEQAEFNDEETNIYHQGENRDSSSSDPGYDEKADNVRAVDEQKISPIENTIERSDNSTVPDKDITTEQKLIDEKKSRESLSNENELQHLPVADLAAITRAFQRKMINQKWNDQKTIAVWSPIPRTGVTTFAINFGCFLAENRIYTSVMEGVRANAMLRHTLKRYMKEPVNWKSYASCIRETKIDRHGNLSIDPYAIEVEWQYRNVKFIPLDDNDWNLKWSQELLEIYMGMPRVMDMTIIDLPSGEMSEISYASLAHVDTLLVLVDDSYQEFHAWKDYILDLKEFFNIDVKLIFNKAYPFSETKQMASKMELEVIAVIPSLHEQVKLNYYENRPILLNKTARKVLYPVFTELAQILIGDKFKLVASPERAKYANELTTIKEFVSQNLLQRLFAMLKQLK